MDERFDEIMAALDKLRRVWDINYRIAQYEPDLNSPPQQVM